MSCNFEGYSNPLPKILKNILYFWRVNDNNIHPQLYLGFHEDVDTILHSTVNSLKVPKMTTVTCFCHKWMAKIFSLLNTSH